MHGWEDGFPYVTATFILLHSGKKSAVWHYIEEIRSLICGVHVKEKQYVNMPPHPLM